MILAVSHLFMILVVCIFQFIQLKYTSVFMLFYDSKRKIIKGGKDPVYKILKEYVKKKKKEPAERAINGKKNYHVIWHE